MMQYRMKIFEEYKRNNTQNFYNRKKVPIIMDLILNNL